MAGGVIIRESFYTRLRDLVFAEIEVAIEIGRLASQVEDALAAGGSDGEFLAIWLTVVFGAL